MMVVLLAVDDPLMEIVKITLPGLLVFLATFFTIQKLIDVVMRRETAQIKIEKMKVVVPLRLQAYERLMLYLERISPESLIQRISIECRNAHEAHQKTNFSILSEFEHNISQQMYVSPELWQKVKGARDFMLRISNEAISEVGVDATHHAFFNKLWEHFHSSEKNMLEIAKDYLKEEVKKIFT